MLSVEGVEKEGNLSRLGTGEGDRDISGSEEAGKKGEWRRLDLIFTVFAIMNKGSFPLMPFFKKMREGVDKDEKILKSSEERR